mgnify:CR=1 FL=1
MLRSTQSIEHVALVIPGKRVRRVELNRSVIGLDRRLRSAQIPLERTSKPVCLPVGRVGRDGARGAFERVLESVFILEDARLQVQRSGVLRLQEQELVDEAHSALGLVRPQGVLDLAQELFAGRLASPISSEVRGDRERPRAVRHRPRPAPSSIR